MSSPAKKVLVIVVVLVLFALTILIVDSKLPKKGKDKENPTKIEEVIKEETKSKNKEDKVKDTEENKEDEEVREAEAIILTKSGGTVSLSVDDEKVTKILRFDMDEQDYKSVRVGQILHLKYIIKNGEVEVREVTFK